MQTTRPAVNKSIVHDGLTSAEVQERIERGETNDFKARVGRTYVNIIVDNLFNLFNIVLGTMLFIVIWLGDYGTAFFAGFSVVSNTFLGMIQEINAKRKLDQLATLSEQTVNVWRDGELHEISMRAVVKDDVIAINPGDRLVVDGETLVSDALELDESLLTGESDAVYKELDDELFSGSFVIAGTGLMRATRVGAESNINQLSILAKQYKRTLTPTQHLIAAIVEITVLIMFVFVPMQFVSSQVNNLELLQSVRNSVVFLTSLVPQGLVLVAILSLTIGAIKISMQDTLIQRVNAVESLANATVLCFDKTGTLTLNKLAVKELISLNNAPQEEIQRQLYVYLENVGHLNRTAGAVQRYVQKTASNGTAIPEKLREIPFTSTRKWGAIVLEDETFILGAPERLLPEHHKGADMSVIRRAEALSAQGYRVLAFGQLDVPPEDDVTRVSCTPIALIVLSDQIRDDIQDTLQAFRDEGIELKVVSGDNLATVKTVAEQAGIDIQGTYSGAELDEMSDAQLEGVVKTANVFGRIEPHTKQRIVKALQNQKQYVAMVGDGVNDVPALKQANLAIVMNDGTQISKDIADIVLLNNAMSTLPLAFHEGKETTQTIFGTMKLFLVRNFYNVAFFIFIAFMTLPFPITPIQISWITFGTVNIPATLIAFGWMRPKYMQRFRPDVMDYIVTCGFVGSVFMAILYVGVYFGTGGDIDLTRSAITIFVGLYGMMIVWHTMGVDTHDAQSFIRHWKTVAISAVLTALTFISMYIAPELLEFKPLTSEHLIYVVLIVALFLLANIIVSHGMRYRYLLKRLWMLLAP